MVIAPEIEYREQDGLKSEFIQVPNRNKRIFPLPMSLWILNFFIPFFKYVLKVLVNEKSNVCAVFLGDYGRLKTSMS